MNDVLKRCVFVIAWFLSPLFLIYSGGNEKSFCQILQYTSVSIRFPNMMRILPLRSAFPLGGVLGALSLLCLNCFGAATEVPTPPDREPVSFDRAWKFHLGEASGAEAASYPDASWRSLDIPHDWMIEGVAGKDPAGMEGPFDKKSPGNALGGYLNGGIGWYRKTFTLPASAQGKQVGILFDGAYMNSQVWLNGTLLGSWPYGYTSFYFDLTPHLQSQGQKNVLAIRLNVEQPCSRWYTGAGLYRHVWLITTNSVHVAQWGTFVSTPKADAAESLVRVQTKARNEGTTPSEATLTTRLLDPKGLEVAHSDSTLSIAAHGEASFDQSLPVPKAKLWSLETPSLYTAVNEIRVDGILTDKTKTPFGIRSVIFDKEKGMLLNGKRVQIKGVCNHHDLGCLGAVALRRGMERQLEILKEMGCNAIRTSHNPPSPELLDLCDQMGFLVMDEAFDEWMAAKVPFGYSRLFEEWCDKDIAAMVIRDRNHPSIVLWSIGNEVNEGRKEGHPEAGAIAKRLVADFHQADPTRQVTSACPNPKRAWSSGLAKELDIFGINYALEAYGDNNPSPTAVKKERKPGDYAGELPMLGSETSSAISTRGEYGLSLDANGDLQKNKDLQFRLSEYGDTDPQFVNRAEHTLIVHKESPWIAGEFVWTGFDYIGEPTPFRWPARSSQFGILDLCGFPKDRFYLYQANWSGKPVVHILPHWTWPGFEGKSIPVWVYTNADSVELFLNDRSLGLKQFPSDTETLSASVKHQDKTLHLAWSVPYASGVLKAVAKKSGKIVTTEAIRTAGAPAAITLKADREILSANGEDLSFIKVTVVDKEGNICPDAGNEIQFALKGLAGELAGLDDGDPISHEPFQGTQHKVFHGLGLAVLKSHFGTSGQLTLSASSPGLTSATATVEVRK